MPRLRRGVELTASELTWLERALTRDQRYALIDSGWGDDLRAAFDFAMRHLPELRPLWESRLETVPSGWLESFMLMFWDQAVPLLVANKPTWDMPHEEHSPEQPPLDVEEAAELKRPRHRPPDSIPVVTVKQLKWELAQRKAKPRDRDFTQEKIARRLDLDRTRIQQAEALQRAGWDLLRSHPEFSADDGFVRWPNAGEAARMLTSERAEN